MRQCEPANPFDLTCQCPGQRPLRALFLRQVCKRPRISTQAVKPSGYLAADKGHQSVSRLGSIDQFSLGVIADDQRTKRTAWRV